ncbi:hypothetical protein DPMN_173333 [Dreissena polymorpha]|uniref:Uncharacterized protein n=1 Tax=Dreissena polymorpha TaxID=45954 RepID=A0A9D4E1F7_DREPO|nr:hypothetical protein DPMN_173333 [Dreissena polymorpha]
MPGAVYFVYVLFSVVFQKRWGDFLYRVLDWNQIFRTLGISGLVLVVLPPLVHLFVYAIIALRVRIGDQVRISTVEEQKEGASIEHTSRCGARA